MGEKVLNANTLRKIKRLKWGAHETSLKICVFPKAAGFFASIGLETSRT